MKLIRVFAIAVIASSAGLGAVNAKSLRSAGEPAEFPPASYKGKQYVDSRGCVYIRAGIDGNVTWVPRVARNRKVICGYKPSLAKSQTTAAPVLAAPKLDKNVVKIEPAKPANSTLVGTPKPSRSLPKAKPARVVKTQPKQVPTLSKPKRITKTAPIVLYPAPKPAPKRKVTLAPAPVVVPAPAPKPVAQKPWTPPRREVATAPRGAGHVSGCSNLSAVSQRYINTSKYKVRCGPQAESPVTLGVPGVAPAPAPVIKIRRRAGGANDVTSDGRAVVRPGEVGDHVRVVPRHVYEMRLRERVALRVPEGYREMVWDDDRLNPRRAEQTFAGKRQMEQIWTKTLPRQLVGTKKRGVFGN